MYHVLRRTPQLAKIRQVGATPHAFPHTKECVAIGASFAENFYGLMRRHKPLFETPRADAALGRPADERALSVKAIRLSLVFLVRSSRL